MKKSDIKTHADTLYGTRYPAVNVKVYNPECKAQDVMDRFGCAETEACAALQYAWEFACEGFWEYWQDKTGDIENGLYGSSKEHMFFPGEAVEVHAEGRSDGWLVVHGLPPVESWNTDMTNRWSLFVEAVKSDVDYRTNKDVMLEDIEANGWWKPHAARYNYFEKDDGTSVCIADVKADVIAYAQKKHGFVPTLP